MAGPVSSLVLPGHGSFRGQRSLPTTWRTVLAALCPERGRPEGADIEGRALAEPRPGGTGFRLSRGEGVLSLAHAELVRRRELGRRELGRRELGRGGSRFGRSTFC